MPVAYASGSSPLLLEHELGARLQQPRKFREALERPKVRVLCCLIAAVAAGEGPSQKRQGLVTELLRGRGAGALFQGQGSNTGGGVEGGPGARFPFEAPVD